MKVNEKNYISALKIIACFLVIVNHTNSVIFYNNATGIPWLITFLTFLVSKMGVPLFLMISGALLLNKDYDYKKVFKKIGKYIAILLIMSMVYKYIVYTGQFNLIDFLKSVATNQIYYPLWYLYLYLAILLFLPTLQKLAKSMSNQDYIVFFIVSFVGYGVLYSYIPHYFPSIIIPNYLYFFWPYLGYLLAGYFIEYRLKIKNNFKNNIILFSAASFCFLLNTILGYLERIHNMYYMFYDNIMIVTAVIPALVTFILVKNIWSKVKNKKVNSVVKSIGKCTLLIYLIHGAVISYVGTLYPILCNYLQINIAMYLYELIIFIITFVIAWIIMKIPYLNKLFS